MVKTSAAWKWFKTVQEKSATKSHPDVQCNYCGKVMRNCQLGRYLLPHSSDQCPDAPEEVVASAWAQIDKADALKLTRRPSGGAAHNRIARAWKRAAKSFEDSEDEEEERHRLYWEGKQRYWRMLEKMEQDGKDDSS